MDNRTTPPEGVIASGRRSFAPRPGRFLVGADRTPADSLGSPVAVQVLVEPERRPSTNVHVNDSGALSARANDRGRTESGRMLDTFGYSSVGVHQWVTTDEGRH